MTIVSIERRDGKSLTRAERTSIEFYARHSGYDLAGYPVSVGNVERIDIYPVLLRNQSPSAVSQAIAAHLRKMLNGLTTPIYRITVG